MRTRVYVDGFSLVPRALSKSAHKWPDLHALFPDHLLDLAARVEQLNCYRPHQGECLPGLVDRVDEPDLCGLQCELEDGMCIALPSRTLSATPS